MVKRREKGTPSTRMKTELNKQALPYRLSMKGIGGWQRRERKPSTALKLESLPNVRRTNHHVKKIQGEKIPQFGL